MGDSRALPVRQCPNCGVGLPYRVGVVTVSLPQASAPCFSFGGVPENAVTIDGETRDYAGRFFVLPAVDGRTADEIEVNLGSLDADQPANLRKLDRPSPSCCRRFRHETIRAQS
jgi:hypothetical protein